jgi:hypothetical protein
MVLEKRVYLNKSQNNWKTVLVTCDRNRMFEVPLVTICYDEKLLGWTVGSVTDIRGHDTHLIIYAIEFTEQNEQKVKLIVKGFFQDYFDRTSVFSLNNESKIVSISSTGRYLIIVDAQESGNPMYYLYSVDTGNKSPFPINKDFLFPKWEPSDKALAYLSQQENGNYTLNLFEPSTNRVLKKFDNVLGTGDFYWEPLFPNQSRQKTLFCFAQFEKNQTDVALMLYTMEKDKIKKLSNGLIPINFVKIWKIFCRGYSEDKSRTFYIQNCLRSYNSNEIIDLSKDKIHIMK